MSLIDFSLEALNHFGSINKIVLIAAIFALGGFTKGAIGYGLPTIAVPLLANFMPVPIAISLSLLAIILSNAYQAIFVGSPLYTIKRFWPILLTVCLTLSITTQLLVSLTASSLLAVVGAITMLLAGLQLTGYRMVISTSHEKWTGAVAGVLSGIMGGITSLFSMPVIIFLTNLGLTKDEFVNAISMILLFGASVMAISLARYSVLTQVELIMSIFVLLPLTLSYVLGARLRQALNPQAFLRLILIFLFLNGLWLMIRGLVLQTMI